MARSKYCMYTYELYARDHECGTSLKCMHHMKFTREGFKGLVMDVIALATARLVDTRAKELEESIQWHVEKAEEYKAEGDLEGYAGALAWAETPRNIPVTYEALMPYIIELLVEGYGFELPDPDSLAATLTLDGDFPLDGPNEMTNDYPQFEEEVRTVNRMRAAVRQVKRVEEEYWDHSQSFHNRRRQRKHEILLELGVIKPYQPDPEPDGSEYSVGIDADFLAAFGALEVEESKDK